MRYELLYHTEENWAADNFRLHAQGSIRVDGHFVAALIRDIIENPAGGGSR